MRANLIIRKTKELENNELLSTYACSKANLMMKNATIYHQDALDFSALNDKPLIVVSDIAGYDVKDIKKQLKNH